MQRSRSGTFIYKIIPGKIVSQLIQKYMITQKEQLSKLFL